MPGILARHRLVGRWLFYVTLPGHVCYNCGYQGGRCGEPVLIRNVMGRKARVSWRGRAWLVPVSLLDDVRKAGGMIYVGR